MTRHAILATLVLLACSGQPPDPPQRSQVAALLATPAVASAASLELGCIDPALYGALPDDGQSDSQGIQAAVDSVAAPGGTVCLRSGTYNLTRPGTGVRRSISIEVANANRVEIVGQGWPTILELTGDGSQGDWRAINIRGTNADVALSGFTISSAGAWNTEEQTHLIQVGPGPVRSVALDHLRFYAPRRQLDADRNGVPDVDAAGNPVWERGGDCVRLLGDYNPAAVPPIDTRVQQIAIRSSTFSICTRSSIAIQRASWTLAVVGNLFIDVKNQHIDEEPTGAGGIGSQTFASNVFVGGYGDGASHVALAGGNVGATESAVDIAFVGNVLIGKGLNLYNVRRATITGNTITSSPTTAAATLDIRKANRELVVSGNTLRRSGTVAGPVVKITGQSGEFPNRLSLVGNVLTQETIAPLIDAESVGDLTVSGNDLGYTAAVATDGIRIRGTGRAVDAILIQGNRAAGPMTNLVRLSGSPMPIGAVSMVGNMSRGAATGLRCDGPGFTRPIVHAAYYYDGATAAAACGPIALVGTWP